jgi:hypothetical protein
VQKRRDAVVGELVEHWLTHNLRWHFRAHLC